MKTLKLHEGRERSLLRGHPWVFDGAIASGGGEPGELVRVAAHDGRFLAWAACSPASKIRARVWSFVEAERIDREFFSRRLRQALSMRDVLAIESDGVRLVHGEADGLPGLIVDRYGDTLCAQFGATGVEHHKRTLVELLVELTGAARVYERSDASSREREGLPIQTGWLHGAGATALEIREHGWRLRVDLAEGHKTGYYLDQRDNRQRFAQDVRRHGCQRVLNAYCYTGGFTLAALSGGAAHVTSVDSSAPALALAQTHVTLNGFATAQADFVDADVNRTLRESLEVGRRFDAIVLDPPKLAPTVAHAERAARAYKDINRLALQLLEPGGLLFTFSCSGGIGADLFHKIVAGAAHDAGVDGYLLARLEAASDHPTTLTFPEGEYLKGLAILRR